MHKFLFEFDNIKYHLGIGFLGKLTEGENKSLNELGLMDDVVLVPLLIYYARAYKCEVDGVEVDFTKADVLNYIDIQGGISGEFFQKFYIAYFNAMNKDVPVFDNKKKAKGVKK